MGWYHSSQAFWGGPKCSTSLETYFKTEQHFSVLNSVIKKAKYQKNMLLFITWTSRLHRRKDISPYYGNQNDMVILKHWLVQLWQKPYLTLFSLHIKPTQLWALLPPSFQEIIDSMLSRLFAIQHSKSVQGSALTVLLSTSEGQADRKQSICFRVSRDSMVEKCSHYETLGS